MKKNYDLPDPGSLLAGSSHPLEHEIRRKEDPSKEGGPADRLARDERARPCKAPGS